MTPTDEQCDAIGAEAWELWWPTSSPLPKMKSPHRDLIRAAFAAGAASVAVPRDENEALDLLSEVYSIYENGVDVMEDGDPDSVCIGKSVRISYADEDRIVRLLNRRRPQQAAPTAQDQSGAEG